MVGRGRHAGTTNTRLVVWLVGPIFAARVTQRRPCLRAESVQCSIGPRRPRAPLTTVDGVPGMEGLSRLADPQVARPLTINTATNRGNAECVDFRLFCLDKDSIKFV